MSTQLDIIPNNAQVANNANNNSIPLDMVQYAISQGANIDVIERLVAMKERADAAAAKAAFDRAISAAKTEIPVIMKTQSVSFSDKNANEKPVYKYEDLGQISKIVDPILSKYGLSYRFKTDSDAKEKTIKVSCVISHELGYSEENSLIAPSDTSGNKNAIQAIGSTQTYLQRYTLKAALGLAAAKDDDARFINNDALETITEDQVNRVLDLIQRTNADIEKFCKAIKVQAVKDILAKDYKSVERQLLLKLEKVTK